MVERTLVDEIISIIHSEANNNPLPVKCTIHETHSNGLVDVLLENGNIVTYLPVIGSPRVGDTGVLLYLDDEKNNQIIITNGGGGGGEVDLSNYIQKSSITGLVKNDGSIDSNDYVTSQELPSKTSDLINDSSFTTLQAVYPVGSIYMSINNTNPSVLFGFGVWERIEGQFLLGSSTDYPLGSTGGSADAVIVSHSHKSSADGEYIVTSEEDTANNTKVAYSASGNRWVDGQPRQSHFHHRTRTSTVGNDRTNKNMPPYLAVNIWKRTA